MAQFTFNTEPIDLEIAAPKLNRNAAGQSVWRRAAVAHRRRLVLSILGVLLLFAPSTATAASPIYFGDWYGEAIGRVGSDGSDPLPQLIRDDTPNANAIAVNGDYVYWQTNSLPVYIGRSRLDGTEVQPKFIESTKGEVGGGGLSISGGSIYWEQVVRGGGSFPSIINRANLDGSNLEYGVASLGPAAVSPLVIGDFAYFIREGSSTSSYDDIGRVSLVSGSRTRRFIGHRRLAERVLLTHGSHLFWLEEDERNTYVARASLDGYRLNTRFRKVPKKGCHHRSDVTGAAMNFEFLFLACESGRIDRIALRGRPRLKQIHTHADVEGGLVIAVAP